MEKPLFLPSHTATLALFGLKMSAVREECARRKWSLSPDQLVGAIELLMRWLNTLGTTELVKQELRDVNSLLCAKGFNAVKVRLAKARLGVNASTKVQLYQSVAHALQVLGIEPVPMRQRVRDLGRRRRVPRPVRRERREAQAQRYMPPVRRAA